jgi:hypothetical protein
MHCPTEWITPLSQATSMGKSENCPKVFSPIIESLTKSLRYLREKVRASPAIVVRADDPTAEEGIPPWTTQRAIASASKGPRVNSYDWIARSVGAKTVKGPGPARVAATPDSLRRWTKSPKLSYPRRSLSSNP